MAHQISHQRRTLAAAPPDPQTPMDPTLLKRHPKPTPFTTTTTAAAADVKTHQRHHHPHPLPDPTPPSTIQNISHRFSKLYSNHKKLDAKSLKHPQPEPTSFSDTSCTTLTKSSSQHERNRTNHNNLAQKDYYFITKTKVKEKSDIKKPIPKKALAKNPSLEECDVKKVSQLMSKSLHSEQLKRSEDGFELRRSSVSSIPPMINGGGGAGRRRSFCSSQVELADFLSCNGVKVVAVDMPPFMQIHAVDCARKVHDSLEKFTSKTLALTLKKEFDGVYGPAWHCIVGTSFGSFVTHSVGGFMYFSMDHKLYILLFKTTVQRAEAN